MSGIVYWKKTQLEYGVDYTVTDGDELDTGGRVTLLHDLPAEAERFFIRRETLFTQEVALADGQRIVAHTLEGIADKNTMEAQELKDQMVSQDQYVGFLEETAETIKNLTDSIDDWKQDKRPDGVETLMDGSYLRDKYIAPEFVKTVENNGAGPNRNVRVVTYLTQAQYDAIPRPVPQRFYCIVDAETADEVDAVIDARIDVHDSNADAHPAIRETAAAAAADAAAALHPVDVVDNLTSGGSSVPLSAEQGKTLKGMIASLDVESKDRGVVRNAFTSQFDTYRVDAVDINSGGAGYQAGDALFLSGAGLFIPATIIVEAVDGGGAVAAVTIGSHGSFIDDPSGAELTPPGGRGSGASFDVSAASGPSSTLADVVLPLLNDTVTVLQDETHNGETWQWNYADYNGDDVANWAPNHKIDSELRDFTADPIAADEIAADAVTDAKIGTRALADQPADGGLISTAARTLTGWLQGVRNNLKHVFEKGLFKTDAAGFFKNDGSLGYPTAAQVGLGNVDNTSDLNKPVSTAQGTAIDAVREKAEDAQVAAGEALNGLEERVSKAIFAESNNALVADMAVMPEMGSLANIRKTLKNVDSGGTYDIDVHVTSEGGSLEAQLNKTDDHNYTLNLETADSGATDAKIGTRTLADQPADGGLVSTAAKTLTAWLQGVRNNLKHIFDKGLFKTDAAGFFKNDGTVGYPTAAQVGLGNVDNTSDVNKPVSTAQAAAVAEVQADIDAHEADAANPHGVTAAQVGLGNVDNTSDADKPVSTAQAAAVAEVQSALDAHEADAANPHGVTAAQVGLGNVDNTSDVNKPVSTAQAAALSGKVDKLTGVTGCDWIYAKRADGTQGYQKLWTEPEVNSIPSRDDDGVLYALPGDADKAVVVNEQLTAAVETTLTDGAASSALPPVTKTAFSSLLQGIRNNLKWVWENILTKTAANTWAAVPYTAAANFTKSGFSVKYNAALNIMRIRFDADVVTTFTIGMTLLTLTLPKSVSKTHRGMFGADMYTGTTQVGRMALSANVVSGGALTVFPRITTQASGAVPSLDNCRLYGDVWVYLE